MLRYRERYGLLQLSGRASTVIRRYGLRYRERYGLLQHPRLFRFRLCERGLRYRERYGLLQQEGKYELERGLGVTIPRTVWTVATGKRRC